MLKWFNLVPNYIASRLYLLELVSLFVPIVVRMPSYWSSLVNVSKRFPSTQKQKQGWQISKQRKHYSERSRGASPVGKWTRVLPPAPSKSVAGGVPGTKVAGREEEHRPAEWSRGSPGSGAAPEDLVRGPDFRNSAKSCDYWKHNLNYSRYCTNLECHCRVMPQLMKIHLIWNT